MGSQWGDGFYMIVESWAKSMNWLLQTMWRLNLRLKHFKAPALKVFIFFAVAEIWI